MPRLNEFAGKTALVTGGAGSAIGQATCRVLAEFGASVIVLDCNEGRVLSATRRLKEGYGVPCLGLVTDVSDRAAVDIAVKRAEDEIGAIDILVNSAAINVQGSIFDYSVEDFDRVFAVDFTGCWYMIRSVISGMRERNWGSIVNVTSVAAYIGGNGVEGPYSAAKAALQELTRSVAIEGGPFGIRCNAVAPGLIRSKWVAAQADHYEEFRINTPLRRYGEPEDVANTIAFLASAESAYITGQVINVSGGWYLTP